uniref:Uncharacterized protein n=1 Tax=Arundo donax TaxID=35708 RepID=A0A0A8Y9W5_ARUDO
MLIDPLSSKVFFLCMNQHQLIRRSLLLP